MHCVPSIVLQLHDPSPGASECRSYAGVVVPCPALILIVAATPSARPLAQELFAELESVILGLSPQVARSSGACNGVLSSTFECHAHDAQEWVKLLVVVGDGAPVSASDPLYTDWLSRGREYRVLPLLPSRAQPARALPAALRALNVAFWDVTPIERSEEILGAAGVAALDRRVFISYRRHDAQELAEQLFEELPRRGFDVFLDRFRLEPAADFQERLTEELADKALLLVIESEHVLASKWIEHELNFSKKHDLGRLALLLPGGVRLPWLDDAFRHAIPTHDLAPAGAATTRRRLTSAGIEAVMQRLIEEHTRALVRRRGLLLDSLRAALVTRGLIDQRIDSRGHLSVRVGGRSYALWTSPRPARVADFRRCHGVCHPGPDPTGGLVTTNVFRETEHRAEMDWLARAAQVQLIDEGRIGELADSILKTGSLP